MIEFLLPRTDAGVIVQLIVVTIGFAVLTWFVRDRAEWRMLSIGTWVTVYAMMGIRSIH